MEIEKFNGKIVAIWFDNGNAIRFFSDCTCIYWKNITIAFHNIFFSIEEYGLYDALKNFDCGKSEVDYYLITPIIDLFIGKRSIK